MITPAALRAAYQAGGTIRLATSGTSGSPRWVVRTAASWVDSFGVVAELCGLTAGSRAWVPGPAAATMNAYAVCLTAHVGATVVPGPKEATHAFCPPAVVADLAEADRPPLALVVAGDRLPPPLADRAEAAGHTVHHYYGAAQLSFVGWGRDADSLRLFPRVRAEARDGELWVSSPWLCLTEEGDAPALRRDVRDGKTWMSVGDRGTVGPGSAIGVTGRSDAVVTGGVTVLVADVEAALRPYARGEVVVVGRPHPRLGAVVVAVCTDPADVRTLPALARRVLPPSHRPRSWSVLPVLPRTPAGKVDRRAVVPRQEVVG